MMEYMMLSKIKSGGFTHDSKENNYSCHHCRSHPALWHIDVDAFKKPSNTASDPEVYTTRVSLLSTSSAGIVNRFAGVVEPQKTVKIQKATDRQVKELFVKEGDTVSKGTPLFSYDVDEMQLKLSSAELEFERITNEIATLNDQIKLLQS